MRSLLSLVLLAGYALAAPADNPQFIIDQPTPKEGPIVSSAPLEYPTTSSMIDTNQTIYEYLSQQPEFTKLVKLIDFDGEYGFILNATTDSVTFFAPDNKALTPKKKRPDHGMSLATLYEEYEQLQNISDDDDDEEKKKKRFKKILRALLKYHTIPTSIPRSGLYSDSTYGTALEIHEPTFGGQALRIAVSNDLIGRLFVNYYVTVDWKSVNATNGFLYTINHPIIPPPSILDELFMIHQFDTLTSALQKVDLADKLQWRWKGKHEFEGEGPTVSLFAPTDWAFKRLPFRLRLWLFSPAGEKALKKLLSYHIVPDWILHSDFIYDATSEDEFKRSVEESFEECGYTSDMPAFKVGCNRKERKMIAQYMHTWPHHNAPNVTVNITVPTLLEDHSLHLTVVKPNTTHSHPHFNLPTDENVETARPFFRSLVFANRVATGLEGVARNGAVYALRRVLHPFKRHSDSDEDVDEGKMWDDWEEWLPAWGDQ